ncbi:hypothetical protein ABK040_014338 [Willaertia magna]
MKKIGVIGAGPAGICCLLHLQQGLLTTNNDSFEIICFEQNNEIGGTWVYEEFNPLRIENNEMKRYFHKESGEIDEEEGKYIKYSCHSACYKNLITNTHRMDTKFPILNNDILLMEEMNELIVQNGTKYTHEQVLNYLQKITKKYNLEKFIHFNSKVIKVHLLLQNNEIKYQVIVNNLETKQTEEYYFDYLLIANGHYSDCFIPPNLENFIKLSELIDDSSTNDKYKNSIQFIHCKDYRQPTDFLGKKVIVLGMGTSGTDISSDLEYYFYCNNNKKNKVIRVTRNYEMYQNYIPYFQNELKEKLKDRLEKKNGFLQSLFNKNNNEVNIFVKPLIKNINGKTVIFEDDSKEDKVDVILLCTGYNFKFPFFEYTHFH